MNKLLQATRNAIRPLNDTRHVAAVSRLGNKFGVRVGVLITKHDRIHGTVWPQSSLTMLGDARLDALEQSAKVMAGKGDFVEFGVWRGGCLIWLCALRDVYSQKSNVIGFDTFDGFAESDRGDRLAQQDFLRVSQAEVLDNCARFSHSPTLVEGDCCTTAGEYPFRPVAIARIDVDQYLPTLRALEGVYPHLVPGAHVHLDDFILSGAKDAFCDFCAARKLNATIKNIDGIGALWIRP